MQHKLVLLLCCLIGFAFAGHKVTKLPGYNGPELTQYTGYIEVNETLGKNLFYWLVLAQNNPSTAPLVVWFQGGPGCSGFEALFSEHGPYVPNYSGGIDPFPITWTSIANVLYFEQPVGVGFSYATHPEGYISSDSISAQDNYNFLLKFLDEYPSFYGRPIWLAGESYGGVYIPSLVNLILKNTSTPLYHQLAGLTIGNPVIDCSDVNNEAMQFNLFYFHGLVSYTLYNEWSKYACDQEKRIGAKCTEIFAEAMKQIGTFYQQKRSASSNEPNLDPDDLYEDFCTGNGTLNFAVQTGWPDQCWPLVDRETAYLNQKAVQEAIFAKPTNWSECADIIYEQSGASMLPIYQQLFTQRPDVRVLIFSGDVDIATVPFAGTQACLAQLGENATTVWGPWYVNGATAGYYEEFEHYTYATIKGAGHMCPQYQPLTTFNLWSRFILNQDIAGEVPSFVPTYMTEGRRLHQSRGDGF